MLVILLCGAILLYFQEFGRFQWKSTLIFQRNVIMTHNYNILSFIVASMYSGLTPSSIPQGSCFTYKARDHNVVD